MFDRAFNNTTESNIQNQQNHVKAAFHKSYRAGEGEEGAGSVEHTVCLTLGSYRPY